MVLPEPVLRAAPDPPNVADISVIPTAAVISLMAICHAQSPSNRPPHSRPAPARRLRAVLPLLAISVLLVSNTGCRLAYPGRDPIGPKPCVPSVIPREQSKVTMPDYIIEPPDILTINAISLLPKSPYSLKPLDVVSISTSGLLEEGIIGGEYTIQPNGTIQLGYSYGAITATGKTVEQLQAELVELLRRDFRRAEAWITLLQTSAQQEIAGEHLVAPDGKVNLGTYGRVRVVGMTIEEARAAVQSHLSLYLDNPPNRARRVRVQ